MNAPPRELRKNHLLLIGMFVALLLIPTTWAMVALFGLLTWSAGRVAVRASGRRTRADAARAARDELLLGVDADGTPVTLGDRDLSAHGLILGASGAGKSTTLLAILTDHIRRGRPVVAIDLKGSPTFASELAAAAGAVGRRFALWTPDGPGYWNPLEHGNPTELKDKLIATERFTEPHYQRAAERYAQLVLQVLREAHPERAPTLDHVVHLMEPQRINSLLRNLPRERADRVRDYLAGLSSDQLSAIRGLGTRLAIVSESHTGRYLSPSAERLESGGLEAGGLDPPIDLRRALAGDGVVLFSLNSSTYGKLSAQIGTLVIQDLVAAVGHRLTLPAQQRAIIGIDEFSALGADNVISLLARGRGAGVSILLATQELADLDRAAPGLRDQVLGNTRLKLVHRQDVPASAHTIAQIAGTETVWQHTFALSGGLLGQYDTSRGTRREAEQYIVHPNEIKSLRTGQAVVITSGSGARPRTVRVQRPDRDRERGGTDRER